MTTVFSGTRKLLFSRLTQGSTTFKLKYAVGGTSATICSFCNREIVVTP